MLSGIQKVNNKLKVYRRFILQEGLFYTLARLLDSIRGTFCIDRRMNFYRINFRDFSNHGLHNENMQDVSMREVVLEDMNNEKVYGVFYQGQEELIKRIKSGKRCFVAEYYGNIISYLWITYQDEYIPEIKYMHRVPAEGVYFYNVRTLKDYRGKGIFSLLLGYVCELLRSEGFLTGDVAILSDNDASARGFKRNGFVRYRQVSFRQRLHRRYYED